MESEDYKDTALYEVWKFIKSRSQKEDRWYRENNIPHEPCLDESFNDWSSFFKISIHKLGYSISMDSNKMLNRKDHSKPFSPDNCYFCDKQQTIKDYDNFFRGIVSLSESKNRRHRTHVSFKSGNTYTNTRLYDIWRGIKRRCFNKNCKDYPDYGGRGIIMCKEWAESFSDFWDWSWDHGYNPELSIDRIDVNGDYCPSNCRWASSLEQMLNRRDSCTIYRNIRLRVRSMKELLEEMPEDSVVTLVTRRDIIPSKIIIENDYAPVPYDERIDKIRK